MKTFNIKWLLCSNKNADCMSDCKKIGVISSNLDYNFILKNELFRKYLKNEFEETSWCHDFKYLWIADCDYKIFENDELDNNFIDEDNLDNIVPNINYSFYEIDTDEEYKKVEHAIDDYNSFIEELYVSDFDKKHA